MIKNKKKINIFILKFIIFIFIFNINFIINNTEILISNNLSVNERKNNDLIYNLKNEFKLFSDKTFYLIIKDIVNFYNLYNFDLKKKNKIENIKKIFNNYQNFYLSSKNLIDYLFNKLDFLLNNKNIKKDEKVSMILISLIKDKFINSNDIKKIIRGNINSLENEPLKIFLWSLYIFLKNENKFLETIDEETLKKIFFQPIVFNETLKSLNNIAINDIYLKNIENNSLKSKNLLNQFLKEIVPIGLDSIISIDIIERRKILINLLLNENNKKEKEQILKLLKEIIEIENKISNFPKESVESHLKSYIPPKNYFGFMPFIFPGFTLIPFKDYIINFFNKDEKGSVYKYAIYSAFYHYNPIISQYLSSESHPFSLNFYLKGFKRFFNIGYNNNQLFFLKEKTFSEFSESLDVNEKNSLHKFFSLIYLDNIIYKPAAFGFNKITNLIQDTISMFQFGFNIYNIYDKSSNLDSYYNNIMIISKKSKEIIDIIEKLYIKNSYSLDLMLPEFIQFKEYINSKRNKDFIKIIFNFNKDVAKRLFGNFFIPGLASEFYFKEFRPREREFIDLISIFISTVDLSFAKINLLTKDQFCIPEILNNHEIYLEIDEMFIPNYSIEKRIKNNINLNKDNKNMIIVAPFGSGKTTYLTNIMLAIYFAELGIAPAKKLKYTYFSKIIDLIDTSYKILHDDFSNHMNERRLVKKTQSKVKSLKENEHCLIISDELYSGTSKANAYDETLEDIPPLLINNNVLFIMSTHNDDYVNLIKNKNFKTGLYYSVVDEDPMDKDNFLLRYKVIPDDKYNWWLSPSKNIDIYRRYRKFMDEKCGISKEGIY